MIFICLERWRHFCCCFSVHEFIYITVDIVHSFDAYTVKADREGGAQRLALLGRNIPNTACLIQALMGWQWCLEVILFYSSGTFRDNFIFAYKICVGIRSCILHHLTLLKALLKLLFLESTIIWVLGSGSEGKSESKSSPLIRLLVSRYMVSAIKSSFRYSCREVLISTVFEYITQPEHGSVEISSICC